ncbi:MAG: type IV pilus modification PilV family protein [bacterium]
MSRTSRTSGRALRIGPRWDRREARRRGGVTLVEMMIAMVVLAFGLLGVAALQVRAITESSGGQHLSSASALARNRIEAMHRLDWSDADLNDSGGAWSAPTPVTAMDQTYLLSERVTDDAGTPAATTLKSIEVRAQWSDGKRQNRSVVLSSARLREVDE